MTRSPLALAAVGLGLVALATPSAVSASLSLLPAVDFASDWLVRCWGAAYLAAGTVAVAGRHPAAGGASRQWVAAAGLPAAAVVFAGVAVAGPDADDAVAIASGVVVPFLVGRAATGRERLAAVGSVAVPVVLGLAAIDLPPVMVGPVWPAVLALTAYSLAAGAPLSAVGREWRVTTARGRD